MSRPLLSLALFRSASLGLAPPIPLFRQNCQRAWTYAAAEQLEKGRKGRVGVKAAAALQAALPDVLPVRTLALVCHSARCPPVRGSECAREREGGCGGAKRERREREKEARAH